MKQSVAWFGSMRDSLWKRPYGKRVISGPPDRSLRSPTRIETDVQVHIAARAPIDWQHPSEWQRRTTKSAHQPPSTAGSRHTWMPLFTLPLSEFVMTNKPSPRKELYQEPFPWRSMPGAETHVRCGPENNGKPDSGIVMHHGISTYEAALQEGGLGSPRRTIAAGSSWKAARPTTIEERDTQRYTYTYTHRHENYIHTHFAYIYYTFHAEATFRPSPMSMCIRTYVCSVYGRYTFHAEATFRPSPLYTLARSRWR